MAELQFVAQFTLQGETAAILDGYAYSKHKTLSDDKIRYKYVRSPKCKAYIWIKNNAVSRQLNGSTIGSGIVT